LKEDVLPELCIGVAEAAAKLGVSHVVLPRVVNGRAAMSSTYFSSSLAQGAKNLPS